MKTYFAILISLVSLDGVWLGYIAKSFYQRNLAGIFAEKFVLWPAGLFYLMYAFGVMYFVVNPALAAKSWQVALYRGAFLGLIAYATYDLTNQMTLSNWPLTITIADIAWGVFATMTASFVAYYIISKI
ncbi:MAG: DUF2177 family protein [bacterium]